MTLRHIITAALTLGAALVSQGSSTESAMALAERLRQCGTYADSCSYEVLLASLSEPVTYDIALESYPTAAGDTLSPADYLLSWHLLTPNGSSEGFSAYFDGSHFRFRDERLQEYHTADNAAPFAPGGDPSRGVQQQAQFAELLPQFIGTAIERMVADSTYIFDVTPDTIVRGRRSTVLKGVRRISGFDAAEYTYIFDAKSGLPVRIELENNPGQIGEQSIVVRYSGHPSKPAEPDINLDRLIARKAEAFENYRESSFSLETLPGRTLPMLSAPTASGDRYTHNRGEAFAHPTIIAFVDTQVGSTPDLIKDVRGALDILPMQVDVVWAFLNHRSEDVEAVIGQAGPSETVLLHASKAASLCGVGTATPVLIFVDTAGKVHDFVRGYNQDMQSVVIQYASLCGSR